MSKHSYLNTTVTTVKGKTVIEYGTPLGFKAGATLNGLKEILIFGRNTLAEWLEIEPGAVTVKGIDDNITAHRTPKARFKYDLKYKDNTGKTKRGSIILTYANNIIIVTDDLQITQYLII